MGVKAELLGWGGGLDRVRLEKPPPEEPELVVTDLESDIMYIVQAFNEIIYRERELLFPGFLESRICDCCAVWKEMQIWTYINVCIISDHILFEQCA